jgi:hypothetical protein
MKKKTFKEFLELLDDELYQANIINLYDIKDEVAVVIVML